MIRSCLGCLTIIYALFLPLQVKAAPPVQEISWRDMSAWLVNDSTLPLITVEMSWKGGLAGEAIPGVTSLMARLMNEGAGQLDAKTFQQALADNAISLSFGAEHDYVTARLRCLSRFRATCFRLLRDAIHAPRFDEDAILRMKAEQKTSLRRAAQNPRSLASRRFAQMAYGDHSYGRDKNGTIETINAVSRDDIIHRHAKLFARNNLQVAIVGDMDRAETRRFLRDVFAALPAESRVPPHAEVNVTEGPQSVHIERAGPQTTLSFGHRGISYQHELFFPAFVMNSILGGSGFSSRLTEEVREARGLAYSVYSYWSINDKVGLWRGGVASNNKTAQEAINVIRNEMRRMAKNGVSAERLAAAKTYLTGAYALRFDSGAKIASQLIGLQQVGRPLTYLTTRNRMIEAVTQDEIKRAAALLLADGLLLVSVGGQAVTLALQD